MKLDAYIRVSRVAGREGDAFISPKVQRKRIHMWANTGGHRIERWVEDLDQPGSRVDRPGLSEVMARVESGHVQGVVVAKLDRFARSVVDLAGLIERIRTAGGSLFTVAEGIDTRGPTGKLIADILGAIAEWELGRIRDNWQVARAAAVERGVHISGRVPVGYRRRDDRRLEPDAEMAEAIVELFRRRIIGESWASLATWMNEQGIQAPWESGRWNVSTIRSVVANRVYLGEARAGEFANPRAHEPLVSVGEFEAANHARGVAPARSGRASGLLSGILRCAGCRYAMKPSQGTTRHGKQFLEYRCKASRNETATRCLAPTAVKATVIDPYVLGEFFAFVGDYRAAGFNSTAAIAAAEADLRTAENELGAALDTRIADALGSDSEAYVAAVEKRRWAVDDARAQLAEAAALAQRIPLRKDDVEFSSLWPDLTLYEQRQLLASVFDCVFVRRTPSGGGAADIRKRAWLCWHGEAPQLPIRGQRWTAKLFEFPRSRTKARR